MPKKHYLCCMKLSLKYIALPVIATLIAIFAYQVYWLAGLYTTMQAKMQSDIREALRMADYGEMLHRVEMLRKRKHAEHGTVEFSADYKVHGGTGTATSRTIVKGDSGNKVKNKLQRILKQKGEATIVYDTDTKQADVHEADSAQAGLVANDNLSTILKEQKDMQQLAVYMQRGLHSGLDAVSETDVKYADQLLTKRLHELGIDYPHRLCFLHHYTVYPDTTTFIDTLAVIGQPIAGPAIDYRYDADLTDSRSYLLVMPTTRLVVLRQMSGILATSLVILAIIVLVFWFLIHTIMKQKTLDEMKSDFTNNMTHELKTPIAVAYAANDALLNFDEGISREKQREYLQIGRQQLEKLGGLVEQILAMSMERRKTLTLDMERVELEPLVRPMIATYRLKADKAVDIELVTEPASAAVWADRSHLQHIIGNLIDNAVKYSGPSVTIRIVCTEGCISVGDNGIGIDSAQLPYLFDKFYRVHQGDRQDVQGYGLGLYYAKSLMEHMGGTIAVESTPGRGTTFTLNFKTP